MRIHLKADRPLPLGLARLVRIVANLPLNQAVAMRRQVARARLNGNPPKRKGLPPRDVARMLKMTLAQLRDLVAPDP